MTKHDDETTRTSGDGPYRTPEEEPLCAYLNIHGEHDFAGCICRDCGSVETRRHRWRHPGKGETCKCRICGTTRNTNHRWVCSICGVRTTKGGRPLRPRQRKGPPMRYWGQFDSIEIPSNCAHGKAHCSVCGEVP